MSQRDKQLRGVTALFMIGLVFLPFDSSAAGSFDDMENELALVNKYYQKKQYNRAEAVLNRIIKETGIDDGKRDYGLGYPEYIRSSIKYWQNVFKDRKGYFKDFPTFSGIVAEHFGNAAGYFKIRKGKVLRSFTYERNILVVSGDISVGRKVTVYYTPEPGEFDQALKVKVH